MVAPFDQLPGRVLQLFDRRSAIEGVAPGQAYQRAAKPRGALAELALHPSAEGAFIDARGLLLGEFFEGRIDDGFDRPFAQDLRAKRMDGSDGGFFQMFESVFDVRAFTGSFRDAARAIEFLAQTKFQFAGGFVGKRNGNNMADGGEPGGQHGDDARDQFGGLAGAGRGFDQQAFGERSANAFAGGAVVELRVRLRASWRMSDFDQRVETIRLLALHARFFVGAADGAVIAQGAGAGLRSGRQKAVFDGPVDGFENAAETAARFVVERNIDVGEIAALGAVKEPARLHGFAQ